MRRSGQEFFYDLGHQLLTETSPENVAGTSTYTLEDYVWLDGAPVAIIRGRLVWNGSAWVRATEAATTTCTKLSDGGFCGRYYVVTDAQARPVLMVRQSTGEVTQAATYDAYGHANRVAMVAGADSNPGFTTIGAVSLPSGQKWARLRANYVHVPSNTISLNGTAVFTGSSGPAANVVSGYVNLGTATSATTTTTGYSCIPSCAYKLQTTELEYFRTSAGLGLFTQLRFPGQYLDPETDLIENWNRYYDPSTGRYLSPEPMLQDSLWVRQMARAGMQVPTYAYAANNPLMYVDPDGRGIRQWMKAFALSLKLYSEKKIRKVPEKLDEAHEVVKKNKKKKGGQCGGGDPPDDPDLPADDIFELVLPDLPVFNPELVESVMDMPFKTADPGAVY
ncbi:MAG: RHS repeat-associated core domain-containing protein [Myxococcota bacterium]